jgi:hypothetical protein
MKLYIGLFVQLLDIIHRLVIHGSVHHSTIRKEKSNKMQQYIKIFIVPYYMKLNMFWATHRPSSGA